MAGTPSSSTVVVKHTVAVQVATAGYPRGQRVSHGGVVWISLVNNNLKPPSDDGSWEFFS